MQTKRCERPLDFEEQPNFVELFQKPNLGRSSTAIALGLSESIINGRLKVGQKLPNERELGRLLGVSRTTLREALRMLEADGLIQIKRGVTGGAYVSAPSTNRAGAALASLIRFHQATPEHFAEFRLTFEAENARLAALRAQDHEIATLMEIAARIGLTARPDVPWDDFVDLDITFHETVAEATANPIRYAVMLGVREAFRQFSLDIGRHDTPAWRQEQAAQLLAIAQAIRHRKPKMAERLMAQHLRANTQAGKDTWAHPAAELPSS
jgi:GntR family transcriptional repressor for pyruvate dehydrogenase complex